VIEVALLERMPTMALPEVMAWDIVKALEAAGYRIIEREDPRDG
jgi:hypothetical protein